LITFVNDCTRSVFSTPKNDASMTEASMLVSPSREEADERVPARIEPPPPPHPASINLTRSDYYTIPSMADLADMTGRDGSCVVSDGFTVGRFGYGSVFWPGEADVANLDLDELVHFRHKEVTVYPDETKKPPIGQELNRRAEVTLERVWPTDKTTRQPIKVTNQRAQNGAPPDVFFAGCGSVAHDAVPRPTRTSRRSHGRRIQGLPTRLRLLGIRGVAFLQVRPSRRRRRRRTNEAGVDAQSARATNSGRCATRSVGNYTARKDQGMRRSCHQGSFF
jgi:hypothetical protein